MYTVLHKLLTTKVYEMLLIFNKYQSTQFVIFKYLYKAKNQLENKFAVFELKLGAILQCSVKVNVTRLFVLLLSFVYLLSAKKNKQKKRMQIKIIFFWRIFINNHFRISADNEVIM